MKSDTLRLKATDTPCIPFTLPPSLLFVSRPIREPRGSKFCTGLHQAPRWGLHTDGGLSLRGAFYPVSAHAPLSVPVSGLGALRLLVEESSLMFIRCRSTKGRVYVLRIMTSRIVRLHSSTRLIKGLVGESIADFGPCS
jgi:hypothetical protein